MQVSIDESGDSGFKFRKGSTRYCVICVALIDNALRIEESFSELKKN
jgi:hypothetical protein